MREDADSLVVATNSDSQSCLQVWEFKTKAFPVHKSFVNSETAQAFTTMVSVWFCWLSYYYIGDNVVALAIPRPLSVQQ